MCSGRDGVGSSFCRSEATCTSTVRVDFRRGEVFRGGEPVALSALEWKLLAYFIQHRGDRMFGSNVIIGSPEFEPNKKILMTMENRGRIIATGTIIIRGEGPKYTGRVEFTDEEARVKDPGR